MAVRSMLSRRRVVAAGAVSLLGACGGASTVARRASDLWPALPTGPPWLADGLDAGVLARQGFWYARYVSDVLALGAGLGISHELDRADSRALSRVRPGAAPIKMVAAAGLLPSATDDQASGLARFRLPPPTSAAVFRVRDLAFYMLMLQQLARVHARLALQAPSPSDAADARTVARVMAGLAAAAADWGRDELYRGDLGVYFDSDSAYDEPGNTELIGAAADGAALARDRAFGLVDAGRAAVLTAMADEIYATQRRFLPDSADGIWRLMRAQARLASVTAVSEFRRFIPDHQRRLGYLARDLRPRDPVTQAAVLRELLRVRRQMPPDAGIDQAAGRVFVDLVAGFDIRRGVFPSQPTYSAADVAVLLGGLRAAARFGVAPIEPVYAERMLRVAWESLVNASGLMRGAPPRAEGFALGWEQSDGPLAYRHPAVAPDGVPLFAAEVVWRPGGWQAVVERVRPGAAAALAVEALRLNPAYDFTAGDFS